MSKSISIKEGNTGKTFSGVKRIALSNVSGGGSSFWVPEDETKLGAKHITENGTYKASEEVDEQGQSKNLYGYSEVTVSGIGVATGTNSETGNEAMVDKDENDNLNAPVDIPSSIAFVLYPQKGIAVPYEDGENITLAGATVRGVLRNGNPWQGDETHPSGFIPLEELTVNPTVAHTDSEHYMISNTHTAGEHLLTWKSTGWSFKRQVRKYNNDPAYCALVRYKDSSYADRWWNGLVILSLTEAGAITEYREKNRDDTWGDWSSPWSPSSTLHQGYYCGFPAHTMGTLTEADRALYGTFNSLNAAIDAIIADIGAGHVDDTSMPVTVKWNRVGDSKELSMQYDVLVAPEEAFIGGGGGTEF